MQEQAVLSSNCKGEQRRVPLSTWAKTMTMPKRSHRGKQPLNAQQLAHLCATLVKSIGASWAAVLVICQLATGERADCARTMTISWLHDLTPGYARSPTIKIPQVNQKTVPRTIAFPHFLADLLQRWMEKPLEGQRGSQWPWPGHDLEKQDRLLFPGRQRNGQRDWENPVTERAYVRILKRAVEHIANEGAPDHCYEDV